MFLRMSSRNDLSFRHDLRALFATEPELHVFGCYLNLGRLPPVHVCSGWDPLLLPTSSSYSLPWIQHPILLKLSLRLFLSRALAVLGILGRYATILRESLGCPPYNYAYGLHASRAFSRRAEVARAAHLVSTPLASSRSASGLLTCTTASPDMISPSSGIPLAGSQRNMREVGPRGEEKL